MSFSRSSFVRTATWYLYSLLVLSVSAAPPTLDALYPAGGQTGTETSITLSGSFDPWPVQVWTSSSEIAATAETNKGVIKLNINTNAVTGPHLLRIYNSEGASAPRMFMVGSLPELQEKEPNGFVKEATTITNLPAVMNGRFQQGGDSDTYALQLTAGKTFTARLHGYSIGAPMDPIVQLVDSNGTRVAFSHDHWNLDPFLVYPVPTTGTYFLRVMAFAHPAQANVNFVGGASCVYRVTLSDGPAAGFTLPLGFSPAAQFSVHGYNLQNTNLQVFAALTNLSADFATLVSPAFPDPLRVVLQNGSQHFELEPNNSKTNAQQIELPCAITARISDDADLDVFKFSARKDQRYQFNLFTGHLGFPMNAVFRIEDESAKVSEQSNITDENRDPKLNWSAPRDDTFFVTVRDLRDKGGSNYFYHLSINHTPPGFEFVSPEHSFKAEAGKTNTLKVKIERKHGFKEKIRFEIENLPPGCTIPAHELAADKSELDLPLVVAADGKPFSGAIRIKAISIPEAPAENPVIRYSSYNIRGEDGEHAGHLWIDQTDLLWLTLTASGKVP